jgi:hypothetical protein
MTGEKGERCEPSVHDKEEVSKLGIKKGTVFQKGV